MKTRHAGFVFVLFVVFVAGWLTILPDTLQAKAEAAADPTIIDNTAPAKESAETLGEQPGQQFAPGAALSAVLKVQNAPSGVRAMGYEIWFNPKVVEFTEFERMGIMKDGFAMFGANVVKPGKLRMGGVEPGQPPLLSTGKSEDLFILRFKVIGQGTPDFQIENMVDDIQDWPSQVVSKSPNDKFSGMVLSVP